MKLRSWTRYCDGRRYDFVEFWLRGRLRFTMSLPLFVGLGVCAAALLLSAFT